MGQKVNPHGLRVGIIKDWDSKWYAKKGDFADLLIEDHKIRKFLKNKLYTSGIARITIERAANNKVKVNIFTAKPGMVIGKGGQGVDVLKNELEKLTGKGVLVNITEIKVAEMEATLVAENVAFSLERRVSFRRAMKQAIQRTMRAGAKGIKIAVSGRLGGAEMARDEKYSEGNVPLHTLRADIDYGFAEANTTYGKIGVKVWIYKGEILPEASDAVKELRRALRAQAPEAKPARENRGPRDNNRGPRDNNYRGNRDNNYRGNRDNQNRDSRPTTRERSNEEK
ncbi:30S ribosomal protein S3 [Geosporobacter ferrireducens]|uniref:Small ribosomal subunit protein uS3 n=1 Tax=Geosporobacter ferrireducens TaxID=1424294 RepID=A0A1D8GJT7_9FIRM|nr:30S ribosomal protein S3 [Geosporobacter ferrireducens]AOT71174.1 30S ribosomal protein S3 [Geosporobacter ferrireducens]MTI57986.1 30S ribosomal protein S3 [Geosporobacter ferrireducens]